MATDGKPAALVLAPEAPYPLAGGGALRTASLLHYLARSYHVDLIVFRQPGAPDPARDLPPGLIRRLDVLPLPANSRGLAARALRNAVRVGRAVPPLVDRFSGFAPAIISLLHGRRYDLGVIEHSWCAPYHEAIAPFCARTVLDLHNVESRLHAHCAAVENFATGFAHRVFRDASLALEREWLPRFSRILAVSQIDADLVRAIAPTARPAVYPNAIPYTPVPPHADEEVIVFSGNLEYHPNQSAVRFFRREIWPEIREQSPNLIWRLVGKNPHAVRLFTSGDSRIEVQGPVDDAIAALARARVAVVPLLAGSGTRLKILEAWAACLPVVSTTIGAEGLPVCDGQHLLIADGARAFTAALSRVLKSATLRDQLGQAGRALLDQEFTWEKVWAGLEI